MNTRVRDNLLTRPIDFSTMSTVASLPPITGTTWFNSPPLTPSDLAGKVVLVDFWTYSCVNCRRTLPYLRSWYRKYKDNGFVLLGVHTPEFEFEKDPRNVEQALAELEVTWPVVLDNEYHNWRTYNNRYWPAKYLADRTGEIVYTHFGEGAYRQTEAVIQRLVEGPSTVVTPLDTMPEHTHGSVCFPATPEVYCGYARGKLANFDRLRRDKPTHYTLPQDNEFDDGDMALVGTFVVGSEYIESREKDATVLLDFKATEVNAVLHPVGPRAVVTVMLNDQLLKEEQRGEQVSVSSEVVLTKPDMFNIIKSRLPVEGVVSIQAKEGNFRVYAFTFSGCQH